MITGANSIIHSKAPMRTVRSFATYSGSRTWMSATGS